jgi:hypothetical protein
MRLAAIALCFVLVGPVTAGAGEPPSLDRVAAAVDGAESSHGRDPGMWRADPDGPQGPMQVSAAAASDVGGGDRFDATQNRALGRAYLGHLHARYGNWPDAIAAYNWGLGNVDAWLRAGRPAEGLLGAVAAYLGRVLHDSGLCSHASTPRGGPTDPSLRAACAEFPAGAAGGGGRSARFLRKLDMAMAVARAAAARGR